MHNGIQKMMVLVKRIRLSLTMTQNRLMKAMVFLAASKGFDISDHSLIIYGRCKRKNCPNLDA